MATDYMSRINQVHGSVVAEDDDQIIVINAELKKIEVPADFVKEIGVVGEHYANAITFKCPREIEHHDVTKCEHCYIRWQNGQLTGKYRVDKTKFSDFDGQDTFELVWMVDKYVTQAAGPIGFQVCFKDTKVNEDNPTKTSTIYQWSTSICKEFSIGESIADDDVDYPPENADASLIVNSTDLTDILEDIYG